MKIMNENEANGIHLNISRSYLSVSSKVYVPIVANPIAIPIAENAIQNYEI